MTDLQTAILIECGKENAVKGDMNNSEKIILDCGCKAGGVSTGLIKAGFFVIGVDIEPQPHYPYPFVLGDALMVMDNLLSGGFIQPDTFSYPLYLKDFAAFWASPSCQEHTRASIQWRKAGKKYPDWIAPIRERFRATGKPYVIENVVGAPLINPIKLNAAMFGLRIRRTRLFECSFEMPLVLLPKDPHSNFRMGRPPRADECITPVGHFSGISQVKEITGFYWMNQEELAEAIPWQYSYFLSKYLSQAIEANQ